MKLYYYIVADSIRRKQTPIRDNFNPKIEIKKIRQKTKREFHRKIIKIPIRNFRKRNVGDGKNGRKLKRYPTR